MSNEVVLLKTAISELESKDYDFWFHGPEEDLQQRIISVHFDDLESTIKYINVGLKYFSITEKDEDGYHLNIRTIDLCKDPNELFALFSKQLLEVFFSEIYKYIKSLEEQKKIILELNETALNKIDEEIESFKTVLDFWKENSIYNI